MDDITLTQKDFLTGFFTREHLFSELNKKIAKARLHNEKFSILLVDIDHFKKINDKYGHLWGDEFLKFVASTLRLTLEDKGLIFRYGGDEFVVLYAIEDPKEAFSLARQFNLVMRNRPFLFNGRLFKITISCGLATYPENGQEAKELLATADKALYFSKRYGRNTTTRASGIKFQQFKLIVVILIEVLLITAVILFSTNVVFKNSPLKRLRNFSIKRLLPVGVKTDTTIILKSGDVISGNIVSEDKNKLIVSISVGQGSCTMNIEKSLIQEIIRSNNK